MRISLLHTIDGNRRVFDDAATALGLDVGGLRHEVRADLREAVQQAGTFSLELKERTKRCIADLAAESDVVIVTCATLSPVVDEMEERVIPIIRADKALAAAAAKAGGRIVVLCALESTVEPNRKLFEANVTKTGTSVDVVHVADVWTLYGSADFAACFAAVAHAADEAYEAGATVVAFAHPWMAPAADLVRAGPRPLHSAESALRAAVSG
ncbi:arylsulfatase [Trinickia dabaoshanensis]|uniref:Arylsulfatase n=1 Tax=Trinickia dabaoshanensis TaxID=564714 RepID=A0A2N7VG35_9BURK|nr:arylsulfatase [Trinickia dabaoshanensis]PMS16118.1 arylsulfatase [Trinickia dabaoshanensis]